MKVPILKFKFLFIALLLLSSAMATWGAPDSAPGESTASITFETPNPLQGWSITNKSDVQIGPGIDGSHGMQIAIPASSPGTVTAALPMDISQLKGARIRVEAMVKADGVVKPPAAYNGIKVMLVTKGPSGVQYAQQDNVYGTFDWRQIEFAMRVPADITSATLVLGIENSTGTADFDDIHISVIEAPRTRPAHPTSSGAVYTGHAAPALRGTMITDHLNEAGAQVLGQQWHANVVRFQLHVKTTENTDAASSTQNKGLDDELAKLDTFLPIAKRNGLLVLIDMHSTPGGRISGAEGDRLFRDVKNQDILAEYWEVISKKYRGNKAIWGYDLCNEPLEGDISPGVPNWQQLATRLARIVRRNDPGHAIIVESMNADPANFNYMTPIPVSGIVYSFHMYTPATFTMQGLSDSKPPVAYPGVIDGKMWDKKALEAVVEPVVDFQHDYNVQIFVGEFSAIRWAPGAADYLRDLIDIYEAHHGDWTYHAFREYPGWSVEFSDDKNDTEPSATPSDRMIVLKAALAKNLTSAK